MCKRLSYGQGNCTRILPGVFKVDKIMILKRFIFFTMVVWMFHYTALSQSNAVVRVYPGVQRFIGDESTLAREKYFKFHSNRSGDEDIDEFMVNFDVAQGRGFWSPYSYALSKTGEVGSYPAPKSGNTELREVKQGFVATDHPNKVIRYNIDVDEAADWAVEYYKNFVDVNGRPEFYEPMNEPFVHAGDEVFAEQQPDDNLMRFRMAQWFATIGRKVHEAPELDNMKVIGYSSAWPSVELWNFGHWRSRMKMFMDEAGEHMDGFATHLYDGINVTGQDTKRSGSNAEAILDLIESYSHQKWALVKPHAITEYGGIEKGYPAEYSDVKSIQSIKSINHLLFGLLERQDRMLTSIPFIGDKALWHLTAANNYQPYGSVLWIPTNLGEPTPADWRYSARILFYQLWKDVNGSRVLIKSDNPDIQVQAFADKNTLFVALNNLHEETVDVNLQWLGQIEETQVIEKRSLKIFDQDDPIYKQESVVSIPQTIEMISGETVIFKMTSSLDLSFDNSITTENYYSDNTLADIIRNNSLLYSFKQVDAGTGFATLRMCIGRKHQLSKNPQVKFNGRSLVVPDNWKGYDQANRDDFFGLIEIPVPTEILAEENEVEIVFPDTGGALSSLILTVDKYEIPVVLETGKLELNDNLLYPNPFHDTLKLAVEGLNGDLDIMIISTDGKRVWTGSKRAVSGLIDLNLRELKSGFYLIQCVSKGNVVKQYRAFKGTN